VSAWHAERAWLGPERGMAERVLVEVEGDRIAAVTEGVDPPAGATRLAGVTIPGLANGHSHAFHRALRGRTHRVGGDFWSWRELMYRVAGALDPDAYLEVATAAYAEMALAGICAVGEFHYLHHDPAGRPYADPNRMGEALAEAAGRAGVRLTLIDTCYLRAGLDGRPLAGAQVRGVLGPRTTAVHATHLTGDDVALLGATGTAVCLCPTTERDLADGIGPARALAGAGSPLCLGSDSHAVVDLFEEARAVELDERLATGRRGNHRPADLLAAATEAGMAALGWDAGRLAPGHLADLVTVTLDSVRLAGTRPAEAVDHLVFAATAADVTSVVVSGRQIVADGRHLLVGDVPAALDRAIAALGRGRPPPGRG
jgi:cytosine/adenosine deaminase-related metal-dependent hydrolase